jgi:iron complex outermembrane recepter protein
VRFSGSSWRRVFFAAATIVFASSTQIHALTMSESSQSTDEIETFDIPPSEMTDALQAYSEQADVEILYSERDVADKTTNGVDGAYSKEAALNEIIRDTDLVYEVNADGVIYIRTAFIVDGKEASVRQLSSGEVRFAQIETPVEVATDASASGDDDGEDQRDVIIVTGTNIRGLAPDSSPTRTFDRQDILNSGVSTAQDFIQLLPQNFGGGSNSDLAIGTPGDVNSSFNSVNQGGAVGSSVNLRGLGSGSTLVLLNGHRMAPSSGIGDFVDISLIPASAIERVEVLTDGASSIYGADAVAGVVNFVLRDDFDGAEAAFRYGTVTEGDLDEYRASFTGGKSWNTGNALVVYEYFNRGALSAADRIFSQGGALPSDLLPSQDRHSVLASASQELTPNFEVFGDFAFSRREAGQDFTNALASNFRLVSASENLNVSAGGFWEVSDSWFVDFSGTYSAVQSKSDVSGSSPSSRVVDSDIWTGDVKASGTLFKLPGGDVKLALGGQYRRETFTNFNVLTATTDRDADRDVYAFFGEVFIPIVGPDNAVPGIERLELNVSGRFEDFSDFGSTANPKVGVLWSPVEALRLRGSYSTSFNPPPLGRVGATDLAASAARTSFLNGILGLIPGDPSIADVVAITVLGTGKNLVAENSRAFTAGFEFSEQWGRHDLALTMSYFDIEFENRLGRTPVPGNRSVFDAPNIAFNNPELFPAGSVIFLPSQSEITSLVDSLDRIGVFPGVDPLEAEIINLVGVVRNLARTSVSGFDFDVAYTYDSEVGNLSLGLDGTYLQDFQQQAADTTPVVEQVDTLYNPVGLRLRGRAGFAHNGIAANVFVNYTDNYRVDSTVGSMRIDSWTTIDISLSYDTREVFGNTVLNNTILRASMLNLFDEDPPSAPSAPNAGIFGYDPTNASPLGRFVSFELTKAF